MLYYWPAVKGRKATLILDSGYVEDGKTAGAFYVYRLERAYRRSELSHIMAALGEADHLFSVKQLKP
jgi:hypothetical protein